MSRRSGPAGVSPSPAAMSVLTSHPEERLRMTHTFQSACRTARLRPLLLAAIAFGIGACDNSEPTNPTTDEVDPVASIDVAATEEGDEVGGLTFAGDDGGLGDEESAANEIGAAAAIPEAGAMSVSGLASANAFRGGIPFGTFHLPKSLYGKRYTGSLANISANEMIGYLETARRNGAKVMVSFSGNEANFIKNRAFSMTLWKQRVNRYRKLNLTPYIKDGTLIGHYLIDEPHDPANWGGRTIRKATLDEMAKYSKQLWPGLPTVVRGWPKFLKGYRYRYLDAAWAQYSERFGSVSTFMKENVRDAKASGLALVVGMNQLAGGNRSGLRGYYAGKYSMSASQLKSWGTTMLGDSYPCAFLSWRYNTRYMSRSDIKSAMSSLANKARSKATKSCKGGKAAASAGGGSSPERPSPRTGGTGSGGGSSSISLKVGARARSGKHYMTLDWSGVKGSSVDVYRNGGRIIVTRNDRHYVNVRRFSGRATYAYKVCQKGTRTCSRSVSVRLK